jgi:hypothetical protein
MLLRLQQLKACRDRPGDGEVATGVVGSWSPKLQMTQVPPKWVMPTCARASKAKYIQTEAEQSRGSKTTIHIETAVRYALMDAIACPFTYFHQGIDTKLSTFLHVSYLPQVMQVKSGKIILFVRPSGR